MKQVTIILDPSSPIYKELEREITRYVDSLETARYSQEIQPAEPGKLGDLEPETVKIIIELTTAAINFLAAVITIVTQLHAAQERDTKTPRRNRAKYVEIEIGDDRIVLPVSDETARRFLHRVAAKLGEKHAGSRQPADPKLLSTASRKKTPTKKTK